MSRLLAADIGGTQSRILVYDSDSGATILRHSYPSAKYINLETLLEQVIAQTGSISNACLAVAGPIMQTVDGQTAQVTNLPWQLDSRRMKQQLNIDQLQIINDFEAIGHGLGELSGEQLLTLQEGAPQEGGLRALIGAGTGLGQALLLPQSKGYRVHATEGGHVDFAATTPLQQQLLNHLLHHHDHVSVERLLSGQGLVTIFRFLAEKAGLNQSELNDLLDDGDAAANVSRLALERQHPLARQALQMFVQIYGAQAGNLALSVLPYGGLYIAGGIAVKILPLLQQGDFMQAFLHKGRMSQLLHHIPVSIILEPDAGLLGALRLAKNLK